MEILDHTGNRRYLPAESVPLDTDAAISDIPSLVTAAVRRQWGLKVAFLRSLGPNSAQLQCLDAGEALFSDAGIRGRVADVSLAEAHSAKWERPGWWRRMIALLDAELAQLGAQRTGPPVHVRHWALSSIVRVPSTAGPVWFKAVPAIFAHEGRVAQWVSHLDEQRQLKVLAIGEDWSVTAELPEDAPEPASHPLEAMARIQIQSIGRTGELEVLGCPDRGLEGVTDDARAMCLADGPLRSTWAAALGSRLPVLDEIAETARSLSLPRTLVHGDIHAQNAHWTQGSWVIFDWTDASIAFPFVDLARPLQDATPSDRELMIKQYSEVWRDRLSLKEITTALRVAPALGALHQVETHRRIIEAVGNASEFSVALHGWAEQLVARLDEWRAKSS